MRLLPAVFLSLVAACLLIAACDDGGGTGVPIGGGALVLNSATLPAGTTGTAYSATITASGGTGAHQWSLSVGALPPGLALDTTSAASSAQIFGVPTVAGNFLFTVLVTSGSLSDSQTFGINIAAAGGGGLSIATTVLPPATVGTAYLATLQATGGSGPLAWSIFSGLTPPGVSMNAAGGISGTPTVTGGWPMTVRVTDGTATVQRALILNVAGAAGSAPLEQMLRNRIAQGGIVAMPPQPPALNAAQVDLGRLLFFDKALSGTQDVSCATCHHPSLGTGDSLNLSIGVGATGGIGPGRDHPLKVFIPRNAQPVFNIGMFPELFWDKRVGRPPGAPGGPPPQTQTPEGPTPLAPDEAQALFPLVDLVEMRGTGHGLDGLSNTAYRQALVARLAAMPDYVARFNAAFGAAGMTVENLGRAIAQFERSQTFVNAPWDRYIRGEVNALTDPQKRGALLFTGRARCITCHGGPIQTNFSTHNIGVPQFGPGRGNGSSGREDFGFENVTGNPAHRYNFRVPSLRNVAFTGPYMHNGAFVSLAEVVNHYNLKAASTNAFTGLNMGQANDLVPTILPTANVLTNLSPLFTQVPGDLTAQEQSDIVAFLHALTDPQAINRRQEVPQSVPSGLPVE